MSLIILTKDRIIAARDKFGRLPVIVGKREHGFCVSTESFAFQKLGYQTYKELTAGEIVTINSLRLTDYRTALLRLRLESMQGTKSPPIGSIKTTGTKLLATKAEQKLL